MNKAVQKAIFTWTAGVANSANERVLCVDMINLIGVSLPAKGNFFAQMAQNGFETAPVITGLVRPRSVHNLLRSRVVSMRPTCGLRQRWESHESYSRFEKSFTILANARSIEQFQLWTEYLLIQFQGDHDVCE